MATDSPSPFSVDYVPRIHRAEVQEAYRIGPGMIRVRFGGDDLVDYPTTGIGDEYVRMFFPDSPGDEVRLPRITSLRGWEYPAGVESSEMRVYTIRAHERGIVTVDFVDHDGGVASDWARAARPGHVVGINPPHGLYERPDSATSQLLIADEPGIPAALRIAELTAHEVPTILLLEVRSAEHRLPEVPGATHIWLDASGNGHGPSRVLDVLHEREPSTDTYVWVSTEGGLNRAVRRHLRHQRSFPASQYTCIAYWQERAEDWRARYDELGAAFASRVQEIRSRREDDHERVVDALDDLYESAGL